MQRSTCTCLIPLSVNFLFIFHSSYFLLIQFFVPRNSLQMLRSFVARRFANTIFASNNGKRSLPPIYRENYWTFQSLGHGNSPPNVFIFLSNDNWNLMKIMFFFFFFFPAAESLSKVDWDACEVQFQGNINNQFISRFSMGGYGCHCSQFFFFLLRQLPRILVTGAMGQVGSELGTCNSPPFSLFLFLLPCYLFHISTDWYVQCRTWGSTFPRTTSLPATLPAPTRSVFPFFTFLDKENLLIENDGYFGDS